MVPRDASRTRTSRIRILDPDQFFGYKAPRSRVCLRSNIVIPYDP